MKTKAILLATLLTLGIASKSSAQQPIRGARNNASAPQNPNDKIGRREPNTQTVTLLPDLTVTGIYYEKASTLRVRVMNQGNGDAKACYLALILLKNDSPTSPSVKVWTITIPPLKAHKGYSTTISISPFTFTDHAFLARIDRSDQVKESDESNNDRFDDSKVIH
ncbi:MAG TPA: CARDB domain-containing protein [Pyrinomonadaceae bacterium]|nr:CARDB domain-containing protein [Pyrinomonadaceae bacterium]